MIKPTFLKTLLTFVVALALPFVPKSAPARRGGGSHGVGGSHGGNSHGGGSFHGGGHSNFRGSGKSYRGSRGGAPMSSAWLAGGHMNTGRVNRGSYARPGGFSSSMPGNFARSSTSGRGNFGSTVNSRNSGYFGASHPAAQGSRSAKGGWQSFGNSSYRSTPGLARTSGNAMGGGWHSFGNSRIVGRAEVSRTYGSDLRADGQWHSFGNSRNGSFGRNASGFSFAAASRANASDTHALRGGFNSNRFSNTPARSRFSSFSSFSDGRSMANFGSSGRFGTAGFASSNFGNPGFGDLGFSNSLLGSGVSLIPNLLFGGLLHLGTSVLGGGGILEGGLLAGSAISLAARWLGSGLGSNGSGQGDSAGVDFGFSPGGFGIGFGFAPAPAWPACNAVASFQGPGWGSSGYCGPSPYYPSGWSGIRQFGNPRTNYNMAGDRFGNSDFSNDQN